MLVPVILDALNCVLFEHTCKKRIFHFFDVLASECIMNAKSDPFHCISQAWKRQSTDIFSFFFFFQFSYFTYRYVRNRLYQTLSDYAHFYFTSLYVCHDNISV